MAEEQLQEQAAQENAEAQPDPAAEQLQKLQAERDALFDRLARQQAEFENYRKRSQKEQQDFRDYALADFARHLLPVIDSLDRALNAPGEQEDLRKGVELIRKQLHDALAKTGIKPVPAQGEHFDPRLHEAIEMVETEEAPDNTVLEELQRGYVIKERLLRPAMVRVARNHK